VPGRPEEGHVPGTLVPLTRPSGPPLWLLFIRHEHELDEGHGGAPLIELLERADRAIDALYAANPGSRRELAELRAHIDAIGAQGKVEAAGVDPQPLSELMTRAVEEVRAMFPDRPIVSLPPNDPAGTIQIA